MQALPLAIEQIVLAYAAIWSESSIQRIHELVEYSLAPAVEIVGPGYRFTGHAEVVAEAQRFAREQSGWRAVLASGIDSHHDMARFSIAMVNPEGITSHLGEDIVFLGNDGRITRVVTFWGALPAVPEAWPQRVRAPR